MNAHDLMGNFRDLQLAQKLVEELGRDGWRVEFDRLEGDDWEARVTCPRLIGQVVGRGRSRILAISVAHIESIRRLRFEERAGDVPCPDIRFELVLS